MYSVQNARDHPEEQGGVAEEGHGAHAVPCRFPQCQILDGELGSSGFMYGKTEVKNARCEIKITKKIWIGDTQIDGDSFEDGLAPLEDSYFYFDVTGGQTAAEGARETGEQGQGQA